MPDPVKLLATLRLAREKTLATPGRTGHFVELAGASDVVAAGDLHGNVANFQAVYKIAALAAHPRRHLVLQELIHGRGRYPDGGDKSHQLVDLFAALKCQFPGRVHYLPGNHELAQWTNREVGKDGESLNALFDEGVATAYGSHAADIREAYNRLFEVCPLGLRTANRVHFSHTLIPANKIGAFEREYLMREGYASEDLLPGGLVYAHLWGRDTSPEAVTDYLARVDADFLVCGHIPCEAGYAYPADRLLVMDCAKIPGGYAVIDATIEYTPETFAGTARILE